jgi:AraC family transcriptional regulator
MTNLEIRPHFVTKPSFSVAGLRIHTQPKSPEIPKLWNAFVPRMDELKNISEPHASYGVMASTDNGLDYLAGNPVNDATDLPESMSAWEISENTYAVFESTISTLTKTFDYIFGWWLPNSEYKQASGPLLGRYGETFGPENPVVDIYVPIQADTTNA